MTHFAGKAAKVLFLSAVTTLLLAATALAADQAVAVGATTGSSLRTVSYTHLKNLLPKRHESRAGFCYAHLK